MPPHRKTLKQYIDIVAILAAFPYMAESTPAFFDGYSECVPDSILSKLCLSIFSIRSVWGVF